MKMIYTNTVSCLRTTRNQSKNLSVQDNFPLIKRFNIQYCTMIKDIVLRFFYVTCGSWLFFSQRSTFTLREFTSYLVVSFLIMSFKQDPNLTNPYGVYILFCPLFLFYCIIHLVHVSIYNDYYFVPIARPLEIITYFVKSSLHSSFIESTKYNKASMVYQ